MGKSAVDLEKWGGNARSGASWKKVTITNASVLLNRVLKFQIINVVLFSGLSTIVKHIVSSRCGNVNIQALRYSTSWCLVNQKA